MLNIKPKGISLLERSDLHNSLITIGWPSYLILITALFIAINFLFTSIYIALGPDEIQGISDDNFGQRVYEIFFFSTQILTTLGYSRVVPVGVAASSVSALESMFGVIFFAFATGLSYARFARPRQKIMYSKNMTIGPYRGAQALMVRAVNYKKNQLVDLTAELILTVNIRVEGKLTRFFYNLPLEQEKLGIMMMSWVIVHKITEDSPLFNLNTDDLIGTDAEILIMIKGTDDILSQSVFSRTSFKASQIISNAEFVSINETDEIGNLTIDVGRMHETRIVADTAI